LWAAAVIGLRLELEALPGLVYALEHCGRVAGSNAVSARTVSAVTQCELPLLVAQLETHVQVGLDSRILAVRDNMGSRHFNSPLAVEV
jgi:hypothetical protein